MSLIKLYNPCTVGWFSVELGLLFYLHTIFHYQLLYLLESPTMTIKNASVLPRGSSRCFDSEHVQDSLNEMGFLYVEFL